MTPNKEASWISVWFTEGAAKCVHSQAMVNFLEYALANPMLGNVIELVCIDDAVIRVRASYIQGYYIDTPQVREQRFEWEKLLEKQEKQAKEDWND